MRECDKYMMDAQIKDEEKAGRLTDARREEIRLTWQAKSDAAAKDRAAYPKKKNYADMIPAEQQAEDDRIIASNIQFEKKHRVTGAEKRENRWQGEPD